MKLTKTRVLTPLAALAFAVAAQGDLVPNEGFETFNVGDSVTNVNNFTFQEGADQAGDLSTVQAYAVGEALPETTVSLPDGFASSGEKYLKLSTEDGTLFRNVQAGGGTKDIPGTGLYIDAVVQFTVTDPTDRPVPDAADKFIVWLEPDANDATMTNVCVYAGQYNLANNALVLDDVASNKVYKLTGNYGANNDGSIASGSWHRLTVKAIANGCKNNSYTIPGFKIYIDGAEASGDAAIYRDGSDFDNAVQNTEGFADNFISGVTGVTPTFFPTMYGAANLTKVGFSGEGKVDDIVITETMPDIADMNPATLQISWDTTDVSAIEAVVNGQTLTFSSSPAVIRNEAGYDVTIVKADVTFVNGSPAYHKFNALTSTNSNTIAYLDDEDDPASASAATKCVITVDNSEDITLSFASAQPDRSVTFNFDGAQDYLTAITYQIQGEEAETITSADDRVWFVGEFEITATAGKTVTFTPAYVSSYSGTLALSGNAASLAGNVLTLNENSDAAVTVTLSVTPPAAKVFSVDGTDYTLDEVLAGIADGSLTTSAANPLELTDDVTLEAAMVIPVNYTLYVDLNGNTLTGAASADVFTVYGSLYITDSDANAGTANGGQVIAGTGGAVASVYSNGQLTIYDGYFTGAIASADGATGTAIAISGGSYSANVAEAVFPSAGYGLVYSELASRWNYGALQLSISFNANGGTGSLMADQTFTVESAAFTLSANTYTKTDNTFQGWALASDGVVVYEDEATITTGSVTSNLVLYAVWGTDEGETLSPGETGQTYATQAEAEAAAASVVIVGDNNVTNGLSAAQLETYYDNFEANVKAVDGGYAVEIVLTDSATNSLTQQVNADVATVATKLADVAAWTSGDAVTVTIDATPGFYYSIAAGSTLAGIAEVAGDRVLATGDTVTLALPKQSTAGFYKVLVNIVQKPTGPLNQ